MEQLIIAASTDIGSVRTINQDSLFINGKSVHGEDTSKLLWSTEVPSDEKIVLSVFDGLGGMSHGEVASKIACEALSEWYNKHFSDESTDIYPYFETANDQICELNRGHRERMGSTCTILEYYKGSFMFSNIGDSRGYLFRNGELIQQTEDHNELNTFRKVRQNADNDTLESDVKNTLTQYLGIYPEEFIIDPYIASPKKYEEGDIYLLCSDGLTSAVDDAEISAVLLSESSLKAKCKELTNRALKNGGTDNITIILFGQKGKRRKENNEPCCIGLLRKVFQRISSSFSK